MELENKQQLTVSLFWLNLYRVPGCFPWIQIWMTIQSNANHEFIPLAYVLTTLHKTMGKEVLSSLHYRQPKNFTRKQITFFCLCFDAAQGEIYITAIWKDRKKIRRRAKQVTEESRVKSTLGKFDLWQFYTSKQTCGGKKSIPTKKNNPWTFWKWNWV